MQFNFLNWLFKSNIHDETLQKIDRLIDDNYIDSKCATYYPSLSGKAGRKPYLPSVLVRIHLLFFLKCFSSFNKLLDALRRNTDYVSFCNIYEPKSIPTKGQLSQFRSRIDSTVFDEILSYYVKLALQYIEKLPLVCVMVDSVPLESYTSNRKKKRCDHTDPCNCSETYTDTDAALGKRKETHRKSEYFIGYRKHSIYLYHPASDFRILLHSIITPANVSDIEVLERLVKKVTDEYQLKIDFLFADQAYYDFAILKQIFRTYGIKVQIKPKSNATAPVELNEHKVPVCQMQLPLTWVEFNQTTEEHIYRCPLEHPECECISHLSCEKLFTFTFDDNPVIFSPIPHHHKACDVFRSVRRLIESEFGTLGNAYNMTNLKFRQKRNFSLLSALLETGRLLRKLIHLPGLAMR